MASVVGGFAFLLAVSAVINAKSFEEKRSFDDAVQSNFFEATQPDEFNGVDSSDPDDSFEEDLSSVTSEMKTEVQPESSQREDKSSYYEDGIARPLAEHPDEDPLAFQCGAASYDPSTQGCCGYRVYYRNTDQCCWGSIFFKYAPCYKCGIHGYNPQKQGCCGRSYIPYKLFNKNFQKCCYGRVVSKYSHCGIG